MLSLGAHMPKSYDSETIIPVYSLGHIDSINGYFYPPDGLERLSLSDPKCLNYELFKIDY